MIMFDKELDFKKTRYKKPKVFVPPVDDTVYPKARAMGITEFPYREHDQNGNIIYREDVSGNWYRKHYNSEGNEYYQVSGDIDDARQWIRQDYDNDGRRIYYSSGYVGQEANYWLVYLYDDENNILYITPNSGNVTISYHNQNDISLFQTNDHSLIVHNQHITPEQRNEIVESIKNILGL